MAAHRYWRINMTAGAAGAYAFSEVQFRTTVGVSLPFSGGTASAADVFGGTPGANDASKAADGNIATLYSSNAKTLPQWWAYDLGAGNTRDVVEIAMTARNDVNYNQAPSNFFPQWSDDGSAWSSMQEVVTASWTSAGQVQAFTLQAPPASTLLWTDTFDTYTAGNPIPSPWLAVTNTPISTAQAHSGSNSCAVGTAGNPSTTYRPLGSSPQFWYADFWMWSSSTGGATTNQFVAFAPTTGSSTNCPSVNVQPSGAGRCGLSNLGFWFTFSVTLNAWHHYIFEVLSAAAGTAKLTVDGTVLGTFAGDTRDGGNNTFVANVFLVGAFGSTTEFYIDDLSMYSGTPAGAVSGGSSAAQARAMMLA